jgi:hypothetical protein
MIRKWSVAQLSGRAGVSGILHGTNSVLADSHIRNDQTISQDTETKKISATSHNTIRTEPNSMSHIGDPFTHVD